MKWSISVFPWVRKDPPREATIKYWTHAAGTLAALLIVPSGCAFYIRYLGLADGEPGWVRTAHAIWIARGVSILLTALLWIVEKPRHTKFVSAGADLVEEPNDET